MFSHLLACTLTAGGALLTARLLRGPGAACRHAILLAAVLRFAVPAAWLIAAGGRLLPRIPASPAIDRMEGLLPHPWAALLASTAQAAARTPAPWLGLWAFGCAACLAFGARRVLRRPPSVRPPNAAEIEALGFVPRRIAAAHHASGVCGWLRPRVALPGGRSNALTPAGLRAIAAHELAHIRRNDSFWAPLAHAVLAMLRFHPLLRCMDRRMLAGREAAFDEMAPGPAASAADSAVVIAKVCRISFAGATGDAGATGSNLQARREQIMSFHFQKPASRFPRAAAGMPLAVVMMLPVAAGLVRAQEQPSAPHPDPLFQAAVTAMQAKHYNQAYEYFRQCQEVNPYPNTRCLLGMAEARLAQGRNEDAVALLDAELAGHADANLQLALGSILVRTGNYDRALRVFEQMLDGRTAGTKPTADLYLRIGETYRRKGEFNSAIGALQKAKNLEPENGAVLSALALCLDQAGRHEEAVQSYRDALAINPNDGIAHNNLAYLLAERGGDLDVALVHAQRAKQAMTNSAEVSDTLGWIYLKRGQSDQAFAAFREAFERKPNENVYRTHLAMALDQKGDTSKEAEELKRLLRAAPSPENQARIRVLLQALSGPRP